MRKILSALLVLALLVPCFAVADDLPVVKIGVFEPASGDSGAGGKQETLGMQYANQETPTVTIGDTEYKVELVYADNGSSTDKAPSAAQQLVSQQVSVALGSYGSAVSIAGSLYFKDANIPVIGVTCTNPQVTLNNNHYFRICFLDPFQGTVLANYAFKELGARTAYCLAELGNDYDVGLSTYFQQEFEKLGGTVISDFFPTGNSDFTSYLTNATMFNADVFFCPVSIAYSTQILQQAAAQNVTFPILGGDTLDSNVVANAAKGTNVKVVITTFYQEGANPTFDTGFKAWLNSNAEAMTNNGGNDMISAVSAMGYDAYYTALEALKAAGSTDSAAVMAALPSVTLTGVSGAIQFDETGDAIRTSAYVKTINTETGDWEFVAEQTVE
ncbi:MAG: ABC transporter substrate-binding protein [Clostridia bacterium]|jgi:branched-chain amino acid transport system substrate-binding protein|nr:ABC transporter substrate-binding protein [Clostridia bacterium]MBQ8094818.1 ABC transporter substrate-binding protein [Clostridia bacterium]